VLLTRHIYATQRFTLVQAGNAGFVGTTGKQLHQVLRICSRGGEQIGLHIMVTACLWRENRSGRAIMLSSVPVWGTDRAAYHVDQRKAPTKARRRSSPSRLFYAQFTLLMVDSLKNTTWAALCVSYIQPAFLIIDPLQSTASAPLS
jgi:hypothetical protein